MYYAASLTKFFYSSGFIPFHLLYSAFAASYLRSADFMCDISMQQAYMVDYKYFDA